MHRFKLRTAAPLAALAFALVLPACEDKSPTAPNSGETSDQAQVTTLITQGYGLVDDGTSIVSESDAMLGLTNPSGSAAAIRPYRFWRTIRSADLTWNVTFSDSDTTARPRVADVVIHRHLVGSFHIVPVLASDTTHGDPTHAIDKPLDDQWVRHVQLVRQDNGASSRGHWRFASTSPVEITSSTNTVQIQSVRIQSGTLDTTITDPGRLLPLRKIARFTGTDSVHVTVTTNHADDVVLLNLNGLRRRFNSNGNGTYALSWMTGNAGGWRNVTVDAIAHDTVFDDTAAYDSNRWVVPFTLRSQPEVDFYP